MGAIVPASGSKTSRTVFVVEVDTIDGRRRYGYFCGACGVSLLDHGIPILDDRTIEILRCVLFCCECCAINEAPTGS
jgi:hypothetical protein